MFFALIVKVCDSITLFCKIETLSSFKLFTEFNKITVHEPDLIDSRKKDDQTKLYGITVPNEKAKLDGETYKSRC